MISFNIICCILFSIFVSSFALSDPNRQNSKDQNSKIAAGGYTYPSPQNAMIAAKGYRQTGNNAAGGYNYPNRQTGNNAAGGYNYPNRQTGNNAAGGYNYPNRQTGNNAVGGYNYPNRQTGNNAAGGYNYPNRQIGNNAAGRPNRQTSNNAAGQYNFPNHQNANNPIRARNYPKRQNAKNIAREYNYPNSENTNNIAGAYNYPNRQNPNIAAGVKNQNADSDIPRKTDLEKYVLALDNLLKFYIKAPNDVDVNIVFGFFLLKVNLYSAFNKKIGPDGNITGIPVALSDKIRNITRMNEGILRYFRMMSAVSEDPMRYHKQLKKISTLFSNETLWVSLLKTFDSKEVLEPPEISYNDIVYRFSSWPEYKTQIENVRRMMPSFELTEKCIITLAENKVYRGNFTWAKCSLPSECYTGIAAGNDLGYAMTNRYKMPDWTWLLLAALFGAASVLVVPVVLLLYFMRPFEKKPLVEEQYSLPVTLPPEILNELTRGAGCTPEGALNAMLQFIFQQSTADTRWLRRRMATELAELLAKTSSGKIFESLTLRSLEVGTEFPTITNLRLLSGEMEDDGARMRSLDLNFDLAYDGNFRIDVDAVMLLGKIANISITVESISGNVRVMFRRTPYTHWALAFETQPKLDLRVRGRFQGRQLKPRLASLVAAHIRRAVAQRHTLPNYKIRYKPFFPKSEPGSAESEDGPTPQGRLTVRLVEVTRLQWSGGNGTVRAALAVDSHGWVSLRRGVLVLDIVLPAVSGPLGLVCCQGVGVVLVDTVVPMSPAYRADLRRDDVVLAIDNKPVNNVAQVGKLLKCVERRAVTVRVRRGGTTCGGVRREEGLTAGAAAGETRRGMRTNFTFRRVSEVMEGVRLQGMRATASKANLQESESPSKTSDSQNETEPQTKQKAETVRQHSTKGPEPGPGNFGLRKRRCSVENKSSDSSAGSTPPASGASTPLRQATAINKTVKHPDIPIIRTDSSECKVTEKVEALDEEDQMFETGGPRQSEHVEICQMFWTKNIQLKPIIPFDEETEFKLNENHKYLNINIWATVPGEKDEVLLGYLNIPLASLLAECQDSTVPHHMKRYQFLPPDVDIKFSKSHKLSSHAGFEPCLCFGDALVWWEWEGAGTNRSANRTTKEPPAPKPPKPTRAAHDFVRTHFHRSTQCDFCNKKIWLKDAMQCRNCGLCCHKKCVAKCQESSPCIPKQDQESSGMNCPPPELIMTEADAVDPDSEDEPERKDSLDVHEEGGGAMSALVAGLRRAGSAHSLSAPKTNSSSRSLPPSPSHTPRKQSLEPVGNPFGGCGATWLQKADVSAMLQPALHSGLPPDALLAAARDCAPELAARLSAQQIHEMLQAVREELSAEDAGAGGEDGGESRACALTALMLHCCAAAQLAQQRADIAPT